MAVCLGGSLAEEEMLSAGKGERETSPTPKTEASCRCLKAEGGPSLLHSSNRLPAVGVHTDLSLDRVSRV